MHPDRNQIADLIIAENSPLPQPFFAQQTIPFLNLPSEVRNKIYHFLGPSLITKSCREGFDAAWLDVPFLEPNDFALFTGNRRDRMWRRDARHPHSDLAATCRQIYQEIGQARWESSIKAFEVWLKGGFFMKYPFNADPFGTLPNRSGSADKLAGAECAFHVGLC